MSFIELLIILLVAIGIIDKSKIKLALKLSNLYDRNNKGKISKKNFMDAYLILGEKSKKFIR